MDSKHYKDWVKGIFDRSASLYGQKYNTYFDYFAKNIVALANLTPTACVLDIATGRGAIVKEVLKKIGSSGHVVGTDISPVMIEETKKSLGEHPNLELMCMDAEHLDFKDNSFDVIFCGLAVFFFPDMAQALKECYRVLKPGGKIVISTWGKASPLALFFDEESSKFGIKEKILFQVFKDQGLLKTLSEQGFTQIAVTPDFLDYVYPTVDDWLMALWASFVRVKVEKFNADELKEFEVVARRTLTPYLKDDGLHEPLHVDYTYAVK